MGHFNNIFWQDFFRKGNILLFSFILTEVSFVDVVEQKLENRKVRAQTIFELGRYPENFRVVFDEDEVVRHFFHLIAWFWSEIFVWSFSTIFQLQNGEDCDTMIQDDEN